MKDEGRVQVREGKEGKKAELRCGETSMKKNVGDKEDTRGHARLPPRSWQYSELVFTLCNFQVPAW